MSHMVIYRGADGKPGYHQTDDIHDAVSFVEQMRNEESVEHARIFRLEEVVFEYRPYYRVELQGGGSLDAGDITNSIDAKSTAEVGPGSSSNGSNSPSDTSNSSTSNGEDTGAGSSKRGLFGR